MNNNPSPNHSNPKILSPMMDIIFKLLMGTENSKEDLTNFLMSVLNLSADEYDDITISNPFLPQEYRGDKLGILDVKLKLKSGKVLNIEVQVDPMPHMDNRIMFYVSKLITEQMGESDRYEKIKPVISIIITGHPLIKKSEKYHHHFRLYDIESGVLLTDTLAIHTLEVPKARGISNGNNEHDNENNSKAELLNWMKFFDIKTEEELKMLAEKSPAMKKVTMRLLELSADEKARQLYEARLKEQRDSWARESGARQDERLIIAKNMLMDDEPFDKIIRYTGLSYSEIEELQNADF